MLDINDIGFQIFDYIFLRYSKNVYQSYEYIIWVLYDFTKTELVEIDIMESTSEKSPEESTMLMNAILSSKEIQIINTNL